MEQKEIRFIDSNYNELFRIKDGEEITIKFKDGSICDRKCKYIDDYHAEIGCNVFHICEFAELMEKGNSIYRPKDIPGYTLEKITQEEFEYTFAPKNEDKNNRGCICYIRGYFDNTVYERLQMSSMIENRDNYIKYKTQDFSLECYKLLPISIRYTDKAEHDYKQTVTNPTCTEHGYTTYTCVNCGDEFVSDYTEKKPHNYKAEITNPTCTEFGFTTYTCVDCGDTYVADYTDKTEHNYDKKVIPPTCTEHGYTVYTCPDCGKEYIGDLTDCEKHTYKKTVVPPTCTEMGYTIYTCESCGDSYKADYVDKAAHDYTKTVTAPTCTALGYTVYECKNCDYKYISDYTDKINHSYIADVTEPTCTASGYTVYTCENCGKTYTADYKDMTGHKPSEWIIDEPATIEHAGEKHIECITCGEVLSRAAIPQLVEKDRTDEDGNSKVGDFSILVTNKDGKPIFDSEISIDINDNVTIKLPSGRLLDYADQTIITAMNTDSQTPKAELQILIYDENNNAATGKTDENGGGEVIVPTGEYTVGCIRLRSNITLHLMENAVLKGSRNPDIYGNYLNDTLEPIPEHIKTDKLWSRNMVEKTPIRDHSFIRIAASRWHNSIIKALYANNVAIIGEKGSMINGCDCFDELGEEYYRGPHAIDMSYCTNIRLSGYTVINSANWAHSILYCKNIDVENVEVRAGHDGVHFTCCDNIRVTDCCFYTGDDCIAGFDNVNMTVTGCECNTACSAFRLGGTNVFITKCHIFGPAKYTFRGALSDEEKRSGITNSSNIGKRYNMLSVFTYTASFAFDIRYQPGNIVMTDCSVENCDKLLHYNFSGNEIWQRHRPFANIQIKNIKASGLVMPSIIYGDDDIKVSAEIENCELSYANECDSFIYAANFEKISFKDTDFNGKCTDSVVKVWGEEGRINDSGLKTNESSLVAKATGVFTCSPI